MAKTDYVGLELSGKLEAAYLYAGLLGSDLLPFCHLPFRVVFAPVTPSGSGYVILRRPELRAQGHLSADRWLASVESEWERRRKGKASKVDVYQYLDWGAKLSKQDPSSKFAVVYNTSGTYIAACTVDLTSAISVRGNGQEIGLRGFLADITSVHYRSNRREECLYLTSVLNSSVVDSIIKPGQARGLWGARHIHQKPLQIGIPPFNPENDRHTEVARLSINCASEAVRLRDEFILEKGGHVDALQPQIVGRLRSKIREALTDELARIDNIVCDILAV